MVKRFLFLVMSGMLATAAFSQSSERVAFAKGQDNASVAASVTGDTYRDYLLGASAGQTMSVALKSDASSTAYFNILPPGSDGEAIFIGSVEGNAARVILPGDGDYAVRVYLMGNDRDTGATVPFTLSMKIQ